MTGDSLDGPSNAFGGSSNDLGEAARQLERRGFAGRVGYEHDPRRYDRVAAVGWTRDER